MIDANKFVKVLDWEDVPEKFKFRAQDSDGILYYYDGKPKLDKQDTFNSNGHNYIISVEYISNPNWQNSLEERPKLLPRTEEEVIAKIDGKWKSGMFVQKVDTSEFLFYAFQGEEVAYKLTDDLEWEYLKDIEL